MTSWYHMTSCMFKMSAVQNPHDILEDSFVSIPTKEFLYKILVIGEFGVGKTSIIRRYTEGYFTPNYKLTIGVDFALKTLKWDENTKVNLQLWDIAGHERFGHMTRVYYKYAIAAIIVFDLSRPATFDSVLKWLDDVNSKVMLSNEEPVPVMLLANKCDIDNTVITKAILDKFCTDHGIVKWFPTSAKIDKNIEKAISYLVGLVIKLPAQDVRSVEKAELHHEPLTEEYYDSIEDVPKTKRSLCCT